MPKRSLLADQVAGLMPRPTHREIVAFLVQYAREFPTAPETLLQHHPRIAALVAALSVEPPPGCDRDDVPLLLLGQLPHLAAERRRKQTAGLRATKAQQADENKERDLNVFLRLAACRTRADRLARARAEAQEAGLTVKSIWNIESRIRAEYKLPKWNAAIYR